MLDRTKWQRWLCSWIIHVTAVLARNERRICRWLIADAGMNKSGNEAGDLNDGAFLKWFYPCNHTAFQELMITQTKKAEIPPTPMQASLVFWSCTIDEKERSTIPTAVFCPPFRMCLACSWIATANCFMSGWPARNLTSCMSRGGGYENSVFFSNLWYR